MTTLLIRPATLEDAERMLAIYAPAVRDTSISFEYEVPSVDEFGRRVREISSKYPWLVAVLDGAVVGYAYACEHRARKAYQWSVEVSAYIDETHRAQGIGRALYTELLQELRRRGFYNAYAGITLPNPASVRLHESMGFTPIGVYHRIGFKFGAWHDVGWWELSIQPHSDRPEPVSPSTH